MGEIVQVSASRVELPAWLQELAQDVRRLEFVGVVATKHAIGVRILADFDKFGRPEYGSCRMQQLAAEAGCGVADLYRCVQFAREYPTFSSVDENLTWEQVKRKLLPKPQAEPKPLPAGKYTVLLADPPWQYIDKKPGFGGAEDHYPTMSVEELCALPVKDLAAPDSVLFLWVTSPILAECWPVIEAWGFSYKASFVWDKVRPNWGHYNSVRHEFLLLCTRGACVPDGVATTDSVQQVERTEGHSVKPEEFRALIDSMYVSGPRIELFARRRVEGWAAWGLEAGDA